MNQTSGIENYEILEHIGSGSFADVYKATHIVTKCLVAIKIIPKNNLEDPEIKQIFEEETNLCRKFDHPFITNYFENFEDENSYYITMEYLPSGDLLDEVNKKKGLSEKQAHRYFCQLVSALEYLHSELHVIHRDIKAENIMLDKYKNIRLADFGLSKHFTSTNPFRETMCGSPAYASPEMIKNQPYTASADIWSTGVLLYALLCGVLPFNSDNSTAVMHQIVHQEPLYPLFLSPECRDLLKKLLKKDWRNRITISEIKDHPWVAKQKNTLTISYDFGASFSINGFHGKTIDHNILKKLKKLGYDIEGLASELVTSIVTPRTAVYKMLRRKQMAKLIYQWLHEKVPTNIIPSQLPAINVNQIAEKSKLGHGKISLIKSGGFNTIKRPTIKLPIQFHLTAPVSPPQQYRKIPLDNL